MTQKSAPQSAQSAQSGSIATLFAMLLIPIIGITGLTVDVGRAYLVRNKLAFALDAAALAVGASTGSESELNQKLDDYMQANFKGEKLVIDTDVDMSLTDNKVLVMANAKMSAGFLRIIGKDVITVSATTEVTRETTGLEVALVLDNTGSMNTNNNIGALRDASHDLVDILFGDETAPEYLRVAIVPYSASVNVGSIAPDIVSDPATAPYSASDPAKWKGCVIERSYPNDIKDTSLASGGMWKTYRWATAVDNNWSTSINNNVAACNNMTGPNLGCPTPIVLLTNNRSVLDSTISGLKAWCRGGTIGNFGLAWGWRVLSPEAPFTEGLPYDEPGWRKVVVMMTDGDNQMYRHAVTGSTFKSDYSGYKRLDDNVLGTTSQSTAKKTIDKRVGEVCQSIKDAGITVFTITFTSGIDNATRNIYKKCASAPEYYFDAPSQQDLKDAFRAVGNKLSNLRVSR